MIEETSAAGGPFAAHHRPRNPPPYSAASVFSRNECNHLKHATPWWVHWQHKTRPPHDRSTNTLSHHLAAVVGRRHDLCVLYWEGGKSPVPRRRGCFGERQPSHRNCQRPGERPVGGRAGPATRTSSSRSQGGIRRQTGRAWSLLWAEPRQHRLQHPPAWLGGWSGSFVVCALGPAHGRRFVGAALDVARAVAVCIRGTGAVLFRCAVLPCRLACSAGRQRQHGCAGGARNECGLWAECVDLAHEHRCHARAVFRVQRRGDHPRDARQVARGPRKA